ncbi:MAG: LD-carboxypeptidase [Vicinamibacterales bacterium]
MSTRTRAGLRKFRPIRPGSRVALVAPASAFDRSEFDAGLAELARLNLSPVFDDTIFARAGFVAGSAVLRAEALMHAMTRDDVDAVVAVRGGYGSVETLPYLDRERLRRRPVALVGYSDITSLHLFLGGHVGMTSVHGAMIDGRLARGPAAYDASSWIASLSAEPLGELTADALEILRPGEAAGPLIGGTLTQLAGSIGTPYDLVVPAGAVLFIEDVAERPYQLRRLLMQLQLGGKLAQAGAIVLGEMTRCDEPGSDRSAHAVLAEFFADFPGPVLFGFPSGHTSGRLVSLPLGVHTQVLAGAGTRPRLVLEEAAAEA